MRDEHYFIAELLEKYPDLNQEEREQFNQWLEQGNNKDFFNQILDKDILEEELRQLDELKIESEQKGSWEKLLQFREKEQKTKIFRLNNWRIYAAASVIIMAFIGHKWFDKRESGIIKETPAMVQNNDVAPGQFKASLTLADGSVVVLDSISDRKIVQQGGTTLYTHDGKLVYKSKGESNEVLYNTLTTSKGETFGTVLADGSVVWLNSQSSIRYPVEFLGDLRRVEITGEAYFEISPSKNARNESKPFIVTINGMNVEVLGTKFNINGYDNEAGIKTTLLEGRVKVSQGYFLKMLKPGQQAVLVKETKQISTVNSVDLDEAVAWRFGYFQFNNANLSTVLRQLVRWYEVEVEYTGEIPKMEFWGKIPRNSNLSHVLATLETNGVHFEIKGKRILVSP